MKRYSPQKIMKILKKEGWEEKRIRGSHHIFKKDGENKTIVISTSKNPIPRGTLGNIIKQSGIKLK